MPHPQRPGRAVRRSIAFTSHPSGGRSFAASFVAPPRGEVARQQRHAEEGVHQLARAGQLGNAASVGVDRAHVDERPLGAEPSGEALLHDLVAEHELARGSGGRASGLQKAPGCLIEPPPSSRSGAEPRSGRRPGHARGRIAVLRGRAGARARRPSPRGGPAHMIGVTPMKRMSAAIAIRASGSQTMRSPGVCAGPTSIRRTSRPPTSSSSSPENLRVGCTRRTSSKAKGSSSSLT